MKSFLKTVKVCSLLLLEFIEVLLGESMIHVSVSFILYRELLFLKFHKCPICERGQVKGA